MGFFKDFKEDLDETYSGISDENADDVMVDTLDDPELAQMAASLQQEAAEEDSPITQMLNEQLNADNDDATNAVEQVYEEQYEESAQEYVEEEVADEYEDIYDNPDAVSDETAVITAGLSISGDLDSVGSIDLFGYVEGNVSCRGKLTVSGTIAGNACAMEVFANNAQIDGDIMASGSVKIGQGTVVVGNIVATSAVIAGAVKGNIDVHGPVIVDSSAVVVGDIMSKTVQINNGATIDGRCSQCYAEVDRDNLFTIKKRSKKSGGRR